MIELSTILPNIALLLFGICSLVLYLNSKSLKWRIISALLMGLVVAVFAYYFIPKAKYDLTRLHDIVKSFADVDSSETFIKLFNSIDLEIFPKLISFVISKIGNPNLLQAIIVFVGYSLLFYMMVDYRYRIRLPTSKFIPVVLIVIFGQYMLYYFSGLYNYFAINIFAFGFYLDYVCNHKRAAWIVYILTPFMHISMLLPLALIVLYKLSKEKMTPKNIFLVIAALVFLGVGYSILTNILHVDFLVQAEYTYDSYTAHNEHMMQFYDGFYLFMTVSKLVVVLFTCFIVGYNDIKIRKIRDFVALFSIVIIVLSINTIAITRFSALALFISIPLIMNLINKRCASSQILIASISILGVVYAFYTIRIMSPLIMIGGI